MLKKVVSVIIVAFLLLLFVHQLIKPYFHLRRNNILEGFDASTTNQQQEVDDSTEKSTQMAELFERVNTQMDVLRTMKLSDTYVPVSLDKTAQEPYVILANLRLLINNGIYKNELDIKDLNDKYIGNKGVQLLASDINSVNMESSPMEEVIANETAFLKRARTIVDAHQKLIDKMLESKSKEE
jgi:hypothetical protein